MKRIKGLSTGGWEGGGVQDVCCKLLNVMVNGRTSDGNQLLRLHGLWKMKARHGG